MAGFDKIAVLDDLNNNILDYAKKEVARLSKAMVSFPTKDPKSEEEVIRRIGRADCALTSWKTPITKRVLDRCPNLRYIGISGTSVANIDLEEAKRRGIAVRNVKNYGDEPASEWVIAQLLILARGYLGHQWREDVAELNGKTIGIVGLGNVGKQVADKALGFNMNVLYTQRTREREYERCGVRYATLKRLLSSSDMIVVVVPKNTMVLRKAQFDSIKDGAVLVNISIGKTFDLGDFFAWMKKGRNFAIFDLQGSRAYPEIKPSGNVIVVKKEAGSTFECKQRLSGRFIQNMRKYLSE